MLLYLSIRYLHWKEEIFWATTPKKFLALITSALEVESMVNGGKKSGHTPSRTAAKVAPAAYGSLDNVPGWD